ncbi:hypothetical protein BGX29_008721 [Mortierella sp. GBA35]|nr:hypothetical protein BGX29_008721 [Mortierella sp. GBA35]
MASSGLNGDQDQDPKGTNGTNNKGVTAAGVKTEGLSSGIVAMIVLVVLAVVAAVLSSCYRIRQSRERRKQREDCWVGYNNGVTGGTGGGVVGSIDVKSEALGDGGCPMATVEAAYARRGSLGGTSLKDINNVGNGGYGGNYSPYSQHAHVYPQPPQQPYASAYGGNYY